jgi:hypothetical protein
MAYDFVGQVIHIKSRFQSGLVERITEIDCPMKYNGLTELESSDANRN